MKIITDQHSNPDKMISLSSHHGENCEGKNTLSHSFNLENKYMKSGKSTLLTFLTLLQVAWICSGWSEVRVLTEMV